jgi:ABC-type sugar transport system ATPase subunit
MLLQIKNMQKRFGGVAALRRGDLEVRAGEVHLLLGENGAGKSTLMKIVAGMQQPDGGELLWQCHPARFAKPADAQRAGIAMVHQESLLAPHLSVAENIFLGREPRGPLGWVRRAQMLTDARRLLQEHQFPLQADWLVERLSPASKQLVEICRALAQGSSLLIFDEPTSSLSDAESQQVFRIVHGLRQRGMGIIYITHRLQELRALGDAVTVLRDGETVFRGRLSEVTTPQLIHHMVGRPLESIYHREPLAPGRELLRVEGLSRRGSLHNISLRLRAGEIVGLAGLVGAGRTELCRALFGVDPHDAGTIYIDDKPARITSPQDAVRQGIALVPEDRQRAGLATALPTGDNMTLASLAAFSTFGFLNHRQERAAVQSQTASLKLKADSPAQPAGKLSGGNQQKVVIAKWALSGARVYLFDEPTRGIDIAAKAEVFQRMDELARAGAAVLMVSSELPELVQVADRILVMRQGRLAAELPGRSSQEEILRHAALEAVS